VTEGYHEPSSRKPPSYQFGDSPQHDGDLATIEKRGGSGTAAKLTPDPRTTHGPKLKVQGVC
jgi:hypothetical protein